MSSVCRKGRVPNLHRHLRATEGLRVTGPTLLEDAIHWLTSGVWCLAGDGGSGVDFEGGGSGGAPHLSNLVAYLMADASLFTVV